MKKSTAIAIPRQCPPAMNAPAAGLHPTAGMSGDGRDLVGTLVRHAARSCAEDIATAQCGGDLAAAWTNSPSSTIAALIGTGNSDQVHPFFSEFVTDLHDREDLVGLERIEAHAAYTAICLTMDKATSHTQEWNHARQRIINDILTGWTEESAAGHSTPAPTAAGR
jgi:hypothetical protein